MNSDPSPRQIAGTAKRREGSSGMYRLAGDVRREGVETVYFNWNGTSPGQINDSNPPLANAIVTYLREHMRVHQ
ncbi:MAG: hypothetical protein ACK5F7_13100, partial [Planctomycetaceae bacterium]